MVIRKGIDDIPIVNPDDLDQELGEVGTIDMSWSRLDTYDWCNHKYKLRYCDNREEAWTMPLAVGSIVHDTLEAAIKYKIDDPVELTGFFISFLEDHDPDNILTDDEISHAKVMAIETHESMKATTTADNEIIDVEWGFRYVLGKGIFLGFIDLVFWDKDEEGKFIHILDYKTGKKGKKTTKKHGQTKLYTLATKAAYPGERVKASLYWIKEAVIDTYEYSEEELEDFKKETEDIIINIMKDEQFKHTNKLVKCSYCGYATKHVCPYGAKMAEKWSMIMEKKKANNA